MLFIPVVLFERVFIPIAVLLPPTVLQQRDLKPKEALLLPVVVLAKLLYPKAVLKEPIVFAANALVPTATFLVPVVLEANALEPTLVLLATLPPPNPILTELNVESKVDLIAPAVSIATVGTIQFTPNLQLVTSEYKKDTLCIVVVPVVLTR